MSVSIKTNQQIKLQFMDLILNTNLPKDYLFNKQILDSVHDQIYFIDHEKATIFLNRAALEFIQLSLDSGQKIRYGYESSDAHALNFINDIINENDLRSPKSYLAEYVESMGKKNEFEISINPISTTATIVSCKTGYKSMDQIARYIDDHFFKTLLEQIGDSVVISDPIGNIIWANSACTKLHKVNPVGLNVYSMVTSEVWGNAYDQNNQWMPLNSWSIPRALNGEDVNMECLLVDRFANPGYFNVIACPVKNDRGEIIGAVTIARDISSSKKYEKSIQENYLKEQRLNQEIADQIRAKQFFFQVIIHEIRTLLTPMLGASEILMNRDLKAQDQRLARNIFRGTTDLNRRLSDLIDIAKNEVGILKINPTMIEIETLLQDVVNYVTPEAENKNIELIFQINNDFPLVFADPERIKQIMFNLINNALKFTPSKGQIKIDVRKVNHNICIEIHDTGCGISKKDQLILFNQVPALICSKGQNALGIGLPLCKILVNLHNGEIWVRSQEGKGSTFGFSIPIIKKVVKHQKYEDISNRR